MRHGKIKGLVLAVAVLAGTVGMVGMVAPTAGAVPECDATIKIGDAHATEGDQIAFPVTVSADPSCHATGTVRFRTAPMTGDTAQPGIDYVTTSSTLSWEKPAGTASATQYVPAVLKFDTATEDDEVFFVQIYDAHNGTIADQWGAGTIDDLDFKSVECVICQWGPCTVTVEQSAPSTYPMTVGYATVDGTARAGADFAGVRDGRLTIPAGATRGSITVEVFRNSPGEPAEQFYVVLTSVSLGSIDRGRTELHIPAS